MYIILLVHEYCVTCRRTTKMVLKTMSHVLAVTVVHLHLLSFSPILKSGCISPQRPFSFDFNDRLTRFCGVSLKNKSDLFACY